MLLHCAVASSPPPPPPRAVTRTSAHVLQTDIRRDILANNIVPLPISISAECRDFIGAMMTHDKMTRPTAFMLAHHPFVRRHCSREDIIAAGQSDAHPFAHVAWHVSPLTSFHMPPLMTQPLPRGLSSRSFTSQVHAAPQQRRLQQQGDARAGQCAGYEAMSDSQSSDRSGMDGHVYASTTQDGGRLMESSAGVEQPPLGSAPLGDGDVARTLRSPSTSPAQTYGNAASSRRSLDGIKSALPIQLSLCGAPGSIQQPFTDFL